ncbi:hypothetical protein AJ88_36475 [Mesorhizobium amorphae CCBAU 01583]|nr:hypothetical protein AJ88_36475 [Mesorhizobium amorphae CCBAU 01583]
MWSLVKVERNYQWYRSNNSWNYEPVTFTKSVANGQVDLSADGEATVSLPVDWGRYRLQVETADPEGPATSYEFDGGWYVSSTTTETPDGLEIALDKDTYAAGEVARLKISPHFAGELLVTIGADKLLKTVTATVPVGGSTVDIPVGDDWGAGAYITATLFRPGDAQETRMPARAIGVKWLNVDPGSKKLAVTLTPPDKTMPRQQLSLPVSVAGVQPGSNAYVMVAAVDVGILNLTNYKAPDPENWFFGQRMLGLEIRDLYGRLIDGSLGTTGSCAPAATAPTCRRKADRRPKSWSPSSPAWSSSMPTARPGSTSTFAVQRHRARHGRRLDQGSGRPCPVRRHRA